MSLGLKIALAALGLVLVALIVAVTRRRGGVGSAGQGASERATGPGPGPLIAFVLLKEPRLPAADAVRGKLEEYGLSGGAVEAMQDGSALTIGLGAGGATLAMLMDAPVPGGEAESAAARSIASYRDDAPLPSHEAHLVVTAVGALPGNRVERLGAFTRVVAAVSDATGALGVYWGAAGVTHKAAFFLDAVKTQDPPVLVWFGVSLAAEGEDRVSLLGSGMAQLQLPDLLLTCPRAEVDEGIAYFFDLMAYVVERGEPPAEGDTVGRTEYEEARVTYVPSPIDPRVKVWKVALP